MLLLVCWIIHSCLPCDYVIICQLFCCPLKCPKIKMNAAVRLKLFFCRTNIKFCLPLQLNRHIRIVFIMLSSPQFVFPIFLCYRMSSLSLVALMLVHFNCSSTLSPFFMQFCRLHYLFSTSPLFANVLMLNLSCSSIVAMLCPLMNMPPWQYTKLCIFGLLNLRITALSIHMQTCDTRILVIVLACHRKLAISINNHCKPSYHFYKNAEADPNHL